IWAFCNIQAGVTIGADCNIGDHCFIEDGVQIGDRVTVKNGVCLWKGVTVEDDVFIGPQAVFTNDRRPRSKQYTEPVATLLKRGASIGGNAVIVAGTVIGRWAMIGAGAVVTSDVPDFTLWYGNPARQQGYVCRCGEQLQFIDGQAGCSCGNQYRLVEGRVFRADTV
ncbi:MAG: N-acetyltransferase, partial [Candidatus Zixiibacteriota bacterium]